MPVSERCYAINPDGIAHEVLEGEAILINFKTGSYYSLDASGGLIWECLGAGPASAASLAAAVAQAYSVEAHSIRGALDTFLADLQREGLIISSDVASSTSSPRAATAPYSPPHLQKYSDLEALLLLDPIHDVVATGWPNAKPDAS